MADAFCAQMSRLRAQALEARKTQSRIDLRYDLYDTYTLDQIQMRRKTETLKFSKNAGPPFTNLSVGNTNRVTNIGCNTVPKWSYQANVPGEPFLLTVDESIPLTLTGSNAVNDTIINN